MGERSSANSIQSICNPFGYFFQNIYLNNNCDPSIVVICPFEIFEFWIVNLIDALTPLHSLDIKDRGLLACTP